MNEVDQQTANAKLGQFRAEALATFAQKSWPTRKDETFKYTDLGRWLGAIEWQELMNTSTIPAAEIDQKIADFLKTVPPTFDAAIFLNGTLYQTLGNLNNMGSQSMSIRAHLTEETVLRSLTSPGHYIEAWQRAQVTDGLYLKLEEQETRAPLLILELITEIHGKSQLLHHLHLAHEHTLNLVHVQLNLSFGPVWFNTLWDLSLEAAVLKKYHLFLNTDSTHIVMSEQGTLAEEALFESWYCNLNPSFVRHDLNLHLRGVAAKTKLRAVVLGQAKAHLDHHWHVQHQGDQTETDIVVHGVAEDKSRLVFDGLIEVAKGVRGAIARESNHNLLLSPKAEIDTKPELEIYSHDVVCKHGATIGALAPDALFYLKSRGLSHEEAVAVLVRAFSMQFLPEIELPTIKTWIEALILDKINRNKPRLEDAHDQ